MSCPSELAIFQTNPSLYPNWPSLNNYYRLLLFVMGYWPKNLVNVGVFEPEDKAFAYMQAETTVYDEDKVP